MIFLIDKNSGEVKMRSDSSFDFSNENLQEVNIQTTEEENTKINSGYKLFVKDNRLVTEENPLSKEKINKDTLKEELSDIKNIDELIPFINKIIDIIL